MYLYPGFVLYRASKQAFALIDGREVTVEFRGVQFTERGNVPSDTQVTDYTWDKCNKDGSADLRFRDNHRIPVARYGCLRFQSPDGLNVEYECSRADAAETFAEAWEAFRLSLGGVPPPESPFQMRQRRKQTRERFLAVSESFPSWIGKFASAIEIQTQEGQNRATVSAAFSADDFAEYTKLFVELIAASEEFEENLDSEAIAEKERFRLAILKLKTCWEALAVVTNGFLNAEVFLPFLEAVNEFNTARIEFFNADLIVMQRRRAKRIARGSGVV